MQRRHLELVLVLTMALGAQMHLSGGTALPADSPAAPAKPASLAPGAGVDIPLVADKVRQLMQDRKYPEAIQAIDEASKAPGAPVDYLAWLRGRALLLDNRHDEAVAAFEAFEKQFPNSPWVRRARFTKAVALARKGDFRAAEVIYRAEAEWLLSADRKQQIADLYLEFADAFFKPPKDDQKPDYAKALEFYKKALEVGPKPDKQTQVELLVAQCHQKLGKLDEAAALLERFTKEHADSPLDVEARFHLGECRLAQGRHKDARRTWQDLLAKYPDSRSERIAEAAFLLSRTWGVPPVTGQTAGQGDQSAVQQVGPAPQQQVQAAQPPAPQQQVQAARPPAPPHAAADVNLGIAALEAFIERFPAHKLASRAYLDIATTYVSLGRYEDAVTALARFLADERYKDREEVPDARHLLGQCYRAQKKFSEAIAVWQEYLVKHPAHRAWSAVQREIVDTEFFTAREKQTQKQYDAAAKLYTEFLAKYPLDPRNPEIFFAFGAMSHAQERWDEAIGHWRRLVSKYPNTDWASRAQFLIAETLEQKLLKLEEALEEYRKVTWGSYQGPAQQAIARLTAKRFAVATERVFRSDEIPTLTLTSRNVERVTVRAYKVDLETYFRKMHLARGVESLDIALISPDKNFEFPIPNYAKYQELESALEVPLPGDARSGVMAVTVSSKTHEATTLVLQSDLDIIVKSSRDEVFVFAENMLTGKPWPNVRLLISNGKQVFAEGVTGNDGVFRGQYKELKDAQDVRVFAQAGTHVASNVVGLQGVGVAQGLSDKGYLYTDRPAYRAGQIVHLRGCIRQAVSDAYTIEKGKKYTLEVFDSRNRLLHQEKVALGEFGSFHSHLILPPTSPQGQYRFLLRDEQNRSFAGTFLVHEYASEPVRLVIDSPRRVYYRGEEIEGTIRAEFYYGAPLVGREIRYQLADDRLHTATTDAKGEVRFKLPTREFNETQVLPLVVTLPERNAQTAANFVLACQGFSINVTTVRPVFVAGESFETTVKVTDAEGKPLAQKLVLQVLERTTIEGRTQRVPGERLVEKHELTTAADGSVRKTLKLDKGGRYVLRAEGIDRFKNPISGQTFVQISDDEDEVRLRILADKHTFKVGETASVQIHWREQPALALVTFQGARVLDYKLVQLAKGPNRLEIPMTAGLAPNFELAVAVMTDPRPQPPVAGAAEKKPTAKEEIAPPLPRSSAPSLPATSSQKDAAAAQAKMLDKKKPMRRFHAASSPFVVDRDLRVSVATQRKGDAKGPVRPGEQIEVTVTTTDPLGKPVAAEVSLAMIEQSLLERFGFAVPAIQDFFRGTLRQPAVRTTSSITFAYQPATRPINPQLLAEEDRRELAAEEETSRRAAAAFLERRGAVVGVRSELGLVPGIEVAPEPEAADALLADLDVLVEPASSGAASEQRRRQLGVAGGARRDREAVIAGRPAAGISERLENAQWGFGTTDAFSAGYAGSGGQPGTAAGELARLGTAMRGTGPRFAGYSYGPAGEAARTDVSYVAGKSVYEARPNADLILDGKATTEKLAFRTLNAKGEMQELNLAWADRLDRAKAEAIAAELAKTGTVLVAGLGPQETGYWNPAIVTGPDGKATLTVAMPDRSTAWRWVAKGITAETLAGETTAELVAKKDLFGELKLPMAFTDGDEAHVLATIHNDAIDQGTIEVTLKTTIGDRSTEEKKTVEVKSKGLHELVFKTTLRRPEAAKDDKSQAATAEVNAVFELVVSGGQTRDSLTRSVPLLPYGMPVYATASGSATSDSTVWVEPPKDMVLEGPSLQILIGPTVERSLMDIVLSPAPWCQIESNRFASGLDTATSDLMASIGLQKLLGTAREAGSPQAQSLDHRVRSSVSLLISSQLDDGGWSWTGRGGKSDRYSSARAVWALSLARAAGYPVPDAAFQKAVAYLKNQVAATDNSDYESKAILLHGLTVAGQGDFALANRLYRERPALSAAALAYLALALADMDRKPMANELLTLLAQRNLDDPALRRKAAQGSLPWSHSPAELRALVALAIQKVTPQSPQAKEMVDWLLANRVGHRWAPDKATGPAALALCQWFAQSRFEAEHYRLAVFVNDVQAQVLEIDQAAGTQTIDVPPKLLKPGKQRINFQITGRGRYTYQCILGGFVPAEKLASTTKEWEIRRYHQPAPLEFDGREVPRGFGVLEGSYTEFRNPLTQLPVGRRGQVELHVWRHVPYATPEEQLEYLVITEPIPCGTAVIEKSVQGSFERFEIGPGAITFYVGSRRDVGWIRYELLGYLPGAYRAAPTVIRNAYRPEQLAVAAPKPLSVLPLGKQSDDKYQLTPQELYELGKRHFEKRDFKAAAAHLAELVEKWNLRAEVYKHAVQMLLDAHLELGPPGQVVRYFEIIKEKYPTEEIPFAKIMKVGAAYHEMGEYERSYLVFRATVEASFGRESGVAGFLESQGEFLRSVEVMGRLLQEYPPEAYAAAASYALAQQVYAKAPEAADDPKLRQHKVNRVDLVRRAWAMLEGFLTAFPDDPAADQAAFAAANALLELKRYDQAAAACNRYAQRYPQSDLLDSYWYLIGYCHFATGRHEQALEMCRRVAEAKRIDKQTGAEKESANKWRAIYILGQVYHSLGKATEAIAEYRRVEERFADAKEAILYFLRKAIELPEVTMVKPGTPVEVELKFRNIAACDVKVYRIDLMKFSLLKRNLGAITQINLAGIRPQHEATIQLGDGKDYRDRTHKIPLPLKEEGAYLVVCRGEDLHASGLVLISPLVVEVQEDASSGRVRATVKDAASGRYVPDVHVKVIGSRNSDFVSGATDLRGVFVADGIRGTSTVIAQAGYGQFPAPGAARYAFFRGQTDLAPQPPQPAPSQQAQPAKPEAASGKAAMAPAEGKAMGGRSLEQQLLEGLQETNILMQRKQVDQLRHIYKGTPTGVPAMKAY